jgi:hypothetical protein
MNPRLRDRSPLGSTRVDGNTALNFALYSQHAESVALLCYSGYGLLGQVFILFHREVGGHFSRCRAL